MKIQVYNKKAKISLLMLALIGELIFLIIMRFQQANYANNTFLFFLISISFFVTVLIAIIDGIRKNIVFLMLMSTIFIFQLSYVFGEIVLGGDYTKDANSFGSFSFTDMEMRVTFCSVGIAIIFFSIGYFLIEVTNGRRQINSLVKKNILKKGTIRFAAKWIFLVGYPMIIYRGVIIGRVILEKGYLYYFSNEISVGFIENQISALSVVAFVLYLASSPPLKELIIFFGLGMGYYGLFVLQGDRLMIVTYMAIIVIVILKGNYLAEINKKFISRHHFRNPDRAIKRKNRKRIIYSIAMGIVATVGLIQVNYVRDGRGIILKNLFKELCRQGQSVFLVSHAIKLNLREQINNPLLVLIEPFMRQLANNSLAKQLGFRPHVLAQSVEAINLNPQSCDIISYAINPQKYLEGRGLGSSFILEGYFIGGLIGVAIISFVLGLLIGRIDRYWGKSIVFDAFVLYAMPAIIKQPREMLFSIMYYVIPFLVRAVAILFIAALLERYLCYKKKKYERKLL